MRDWNRRHCARRGHETYAPIGSGIETELAHRLRVETVHGEAWRCLRCGDYAVGPAKASGPANEAPVVLRGKALRDLFILRLLSVERVVRGVVIALVAWGVWEFGTHEDSLQQLFERNLTFLKPVANHYGTDLEHATIIERVRRTFHYTRHSIHIAAIVLGAYALLETVEGVGLWRAKRWGEYLTAVGTSIFLPLEVYDAYQKHQEHKSIVFASITFAINVAAVVYLLLTKRLFGIRGGGKAFEAKRHADALLTVEIAACNGAGVPEARAEAGEIAIEKAKQETSAEVEPEASLEVSSEASTETEADAEFEVAAAEAAEVEGGSEAETESEIEAQSGVKVADKAAEPSA